MSLSVKIDEDSWTKEFLKALYDISALHDAYKRHLISIMAQKIDSEIIGLMQNENKTRN